MGIVMRSALELLLFRPYGNWLNNHIWVLGILPCGCKYIVCKVVVVVVVVVVVAVAAAVVLVVTVVFVNVFMVRQFAWLLTLPPSNQLRNHCSILIVACTKESVENCIVQYCIFLPVEASIVYSWWHLDRVLQSGCFFVVVVVVFYQKFEYYPFTTIYNNISDV